MSPPLDRTPQATTSSNSRKTRRQRWFRPTAVSLTMLSGCTVAVEDSVEAEELPVQIRAVIDVQRTTNFSAYPTKAATITIEADAEEAIDEDFSSEHQEPTEQNFAVEGDVLASMVKLGAPASSDTWRNLEQAGLLNAIPELDTCRLDEDGRESLADSSGLSLADMEHFELFSSEQAHDMAARAFPGIMPAMRGVVFTSRDRKGLGLSESGPFELVAESYSGEMIQGRFERPLTPEVVTVNHVEFTELASLSSKNELTFRWDPESVNSDDTVVVGVFDAEHSLYCSGNASSGSALLTLDKFPGRENKGEAWLSFRIVKDTDEETTTFDDVTKTGYFARVEHAWLKSVVF